MEEPMLAHQFRGLKGSVTALSFHPNTKQIAASSLDSNIMMWNFSSENNLKAFRYTGHADAVLDLVYSSSGSLLASASKDRTIRIWALKSLKGQSTDFKGHQGPVRSVDFSHDGSRLLSSSDDKSIKVWTVEKQRFMRSFSGHNHWVRSAKWSPNEKVLASVSDDKSLRIWDDNSGKEIHSFMEAGKGHGLDLSFHPSGTCIAIGTSDCKVKIYDIRAMKLHQSYSSHTGSVNQVAFHPSGCYLLSCASDGFLKMFDIVEAQPVYDLTGHKEDVTAINFSPKGEYFASGGSDNTVLVWKSNIESVPVTPFEGNKGERGISSAPRALSELDLNTNKQADNQNMQPTPSSILKKMPSQDQEENLALKKEIKRLNDKVETLTQTIFYMEKRMTIVEEQLKLYSEANVSESDVCEY